MNNIKLTPAEQLGKMVYSHQPAESITAFFTSLTPSVYTSFCESLGLETPEAACVALWLYHDAYPAEPLDLDSLLLHCRRLAGRSPMPVLFKLFYADGAHVVIHPIAVDFLLEREPRLPNGLSFVPVKTKSPCHMSLYEEIAKLLSAYIASPREKPLVVAMYGSAGDGRNDVLAHLARDMGAALLLADMSAGLNTDDILLAVCLYGAAAAIENVTSASPLVYMAQRVGLVFLLCEKNEPGSVPESSEYTLIRRTMPSLREEDRIKSINGYTDGLLFEDGINIAEEPALRRLNFSALRGFFDALSVEALAAGGTVTNALWRRVIGELTVPITDNMTLMESAVRLKDLALPQTQADQLAELCAFAKQRHTVYNKWEFSHKVTWGQGLYTLFYGAPGTGKTMAAAALANETGLPLFKVDLARLFSKYIGETQKNIGTVFEQAALYDCILFFDEADALFARRGETADAQDKYANAETAYLLQRMEQFNGVCLLATNLLQNFDEAFRRRISYMIHFPLPDMTQRERIWRGVFPGEAPVGEIDYSFLARHLEMTGASIRNCAVHAAYLAAVNHTKISMAYILAGIKNEFSKQGKDISALVVQRLSE